MRKKSHISLASYLMTSLKEQRITSHKKAFYLGSILPDCVPSFITRKHTKEDTFHILIKELKKVTVDYDVTKGIGTYYCRHLGVISHYLADYCTFPHNSIFQGSLKEHCRYEKDLKNKLKTYVDIKKQEIIKKPEELEKAKKKVLNLDEIISLIEKLHNEYLKALKVVKEDCRYILEMSYQVIDAIIVFFTDKLENGFEIMHIS